MRLSGEPFCASARGGRILVELGLDISTVVAGLFHDIVEDTTVTLSQIKAEFGAEIAQLVDGVTKVGKVTFASKEEHQAEYLRKMFLAMASDIRVILVKLADRLHNMRTLKYQPEGKRIEKAKETLEIFAPLAHRLGINAINGNWKTYRPATSTKAYYEIAKLAETRSDGNIMSGIEIMNSSNQCGRSRRPKHIYSIYNKIRKKQHV